MTTDVALALLAQAVASFREAVDRSEARATAAEATVAALRITVEDQTGLIRQLTNASASTATAIAGLGERIEAVALAGEKAVAMVECDLSAAIERAEQTVGTIATDVADTAREIAARVETLRSALPRSLIIDHAGELVATLHNGDAVTIGPVRGAPGRDAPRVADMMISRGHLVQKMTDGTSFLIAMPETIPPPVATAVPPAMRTAAGDRVKDEVRMGILMDRATDSFAAIGKKYGVSARVVSRIIKEFKV